MVPPICATKHSSAVSTVDLPAADGPVSATRDPGATLERDAPEGGSTAAGVVDRQIRHDEDGDRDRDRDRVLVRDPD